MTRAAITAWSIPAGIGVLSLLLAIAMPPRLIACSGWIYFAMALLMPIHSAFRRRSLRMLGSAKDNP